MHRNQVLPSLTVYPQEQVTFQPAKPKGSITILPSISIPPILPKQRAVHENQPIGTETQTNSEPSNPEPSYLGPPNSEPQNPEPPNPEPVGEDDILSKEDFYKIMEDFKNESVNQFKLAFNAQFP